MSIGDAASLIGGIIALLTFLGSLLACTWHLSAKIQQVISDTATSRAVLDAHILDYRTKVLEIDARLNALEHGRVVRPVETA